MHAQVESFISASKTFTDIEMPPHQLVNHWEVISEKI
jgi:hypothetical protein